MTRPFALDLYCKAGGSARGLYDAGFMPVGVDHEPQRNYPYWFVQGDVLDVLRCLIRGDGIVARAQNGRERGFMLPDFPFFWASPPCPGNSSLRHTHNAKKHPDLIAPTRRLLHGVEESINKRVLWTIENVESDLARKRLHSPFRLCGTTFGLGVDAEANPGERKRRFDLWRHRLFETNFPVQPTICQHTKNPVIGIYGAHCRCRSKKFGGRGTADFVGYEHGDLAARALGLPERCMTMDEYSNAIPPIYAQWIAQHAKKMIR